MNYNQLFNKTFSSLQILWRTLILVEGPQVRDRESCVLDITK